MKLFLTLVASKFSLQNHLFSIWMIRMILKNWSTRCHSDMCETGFSHGYSLLLQCTVFYHQTHRICPQIQYETVYSPNLDDTIILACVKQALVRHNILHHLPKSFLYLHRMNCTISQGVIYKSNARECFRLIEVSRLSWSCVTLVLSRAKRALVQRGALHTFSKLLFS